jgi:hypothetical protein
MPELEPEAAVVVVVAAPPAFSIGFPFAPTTYQFGIDLPLVSPGALSPLNV